LTINGKKGRQRKREKEGSQTRTSGHPKRWTTSNLTKHLLAFEKQKKNPCVNSRWKAKVAEREYVTINTAMGHTKSMDGIGTITKATGENKAR